MNIKIMLFIITISLLITGCSPQTDDLEETLKVDIPLTSEYELEEVWSVKLENQQSDYDIDGNILYVVTEKNIIVLIDIDSGEILNKFQMENIDDKYTAGVSVDNGIVAINYSNQVIVYDTKKSKEVYRYVATKKSYVEIEYQVLIYDNILVLSDMRDDKIYGIDFTRGKKIWEKGGKPKEHGSLRLKNYKDKFLYTKRTDNSFYEFDPLNGKVKEIYTFEQNVEIKNEKLDAFIPEFEEIEDIDFKYWLINRSFDVFYKTSENYIYSRYGNKLYFHDIDGKYEWTAEFPNEIGGSKLYGRYTVLDSQDQIYIFDIEQKKIVWTLDYKISSIPRSFIHEDKLFLPGQDGSYKVFDLSILEK